MERNNVFPSLSILTVIIFSQVFSSFGQISTPCTTSMITNSVPCMGFIMGGSRNGASPTSACCDTINTMMSKSMDCACLIVTGNVPLPSFVTQALAITLPQACGSMPLQCKASGFKLPPPGPILFAPPPPPAAISSRQIPVVSPDISPVASSSISPRASKVLAVAASVVPAEAPTKLLAPSFAPDAYMDPETRPVITSSGIHNSPLLYITFSFIALTAFKYYQGVL